MPIIYLFGADGSGKTTLARLLCSDYKRQGFRTKYSWMRGSHTFVSFMSRFLSNFRVFNGDLNSYYGVKVPEGMFRLWYFLEYVSALPIIVMRFVLPSFFGYVVIADRYTLDLIVWVSLVTDNDTFQKTIFAKQLTLLALKSDCKFFIVADREQLSRRSGESMSKLDRQLELYSSFARYAHVIDTTNKTPRESLKEIQRILKLPVYQTLTVK